MQRFKVVRRGNVMLKKSVIFVSGICVVLAFQNCGKEMEATDLSLESFAQLETESDDSSKHLCDHDIIEENAAFVNSENSDPESLYKISSLSKGDELLRGFRRPQKPSSQVSSSSSQAASASVTGWAVKPVVPVHVVVLTDNSGAINADWNNNYLNQLLQRVNALTVESIQFQLVGYERRVFGGCQQSYCVESSIREALDLARSKSGALKSRNQKGLVVAVDYPLSVAGSTGLSYIHFNYFPYFAMRPVAWQSSGGQLDYMALVFLHELGHNLNLGHSGQVNADNYYSVDLPSFVNYARVVSPGSVSVASSPNRVPASSGNGGSFYGGTSGGFNNPRGAAQNY